MDDFVIIIATEDGFDPLSIVDSFLSDHKSVSSKSIGPHLYRHEGREAIQRSFKFKDFIAAWGFMNKVALILHPPEKKARPEKEED